MRAAAYAAGRIASVQIFARQPSPHMPEQPRRERMLNVPAVVVWLLAVLVIVHAVIMLLLTPEQTTEFLLLFAFIPARYDASVLPDVAWPGGWAADIWTFVT